MTQSVPSTFMSVLGERIRTRREALGLSQEKLAPRCGLHWSYVGEVERGKRNITLKNLLKLAAGLEIDPGQLVRELVLPQS